MKKYLFIILTLMLCMQVVVAQSDKKSIKTSKSKVEQVNKEDKATKKAYEKMQKAKAKYQT